VSGEQAEDGKLGMALARNDRGALDLWLRLLRAAKVHSEGLEAD
jgi:hypothetical protein